jgi:hypothetical protein
MTGYDIVMDELQPHGPCEDFVFSYKRVGCLGCEYECLAHAVDCCLHLLRSSSIPYAFCVRHDGVVLWDLREKGWSAWYPGTNRGVRISRENSPGGCALPSNVFLYHLVGQTVTTCS